MRTESLILENLIYNGHYSSIIGIFLKPEYFKDNIYYNDAIKFCEKWDAPSFDSNYCNLELEFFRPIVEEVMSKEPFWDWNNEIKKDIVVGNLPE